MPLKYIAGLALLCILTLLVGVHLVVSRQMVYPGFAEIENQSAQEDIERCADAITREIYHLSLFTKDWASWDNSYHFIEDLNAEYIESNLNDETFAANNIQLIYYLNNKKQLVWHRIYNLDNELSDEQVQIVHQTLAGLFDKLLANETVEGLVTTPAVPLLLASREIYDSQESLPSRGRLVMGRFLNTTTIKELGKQTHVKFEIQPLTLDIKKPTVKKQSTNNCTIENRSFSKLTLSSTYPDLNGQPACLIRVTLNREITFAGREIITYSLVTLISTLIILFTLLLYILNNSIIDPISSLTKQIRCLRKSRNLHQKIQVPRGHETQALAKEFNRLMNRLEWDRKKRTRIEEKLIESVRQAKQANQAKSVFLANMSHEIRTPMNSILGFSDLLLEENLSEAQKGYVETIHLNGHTLLSLINDILDMSKIESGNMSIEKIDCSLSNILKNLEVFIQPLAMKKSLNFKVFKTDDLPERFICDPLRLRQCLINLLGNAIKFTRQGHVYLNVYTAESNQHKFICFGVEDTGIGISPKQQNEIFKPFAQADTSTSRKFGGTGLGLSITQKLAGMLGGTLSLHSKLKKGSVFVLAIPMELVSDSQNETEYPENNAVSTPDTKNIQ